MKDFFKYIRHPYDTEEYKPFSVRLFFRLMLLDLLIGVIVSIPIHFLIKFGIIPPNKLTLLFKTYGHGYIFLKAVILAPIIEECMFRLNLKTSKKNLIISFCVVILYVVMSIFIIKNDNYLTKAIHLVVIYLFMIIIFYSKYFIKVDHSKYFRFVFYFSTIAFGFLHIFNFTDLTLTTFLFLPLIILPQITGGLIISFLRMRNGFHIGLLYHLITNFLVIAFLIHL